MQLRKILTAIAILYLTVPSSAQHKKLDLLASIIQESHSPILDMVSKNPDTYRCQIIYTEINRDAKGIPHFTNHTFRLDPTRYFNPASMVKMPLAFLSMEKLNEMNIKGVDRNTRMSFDSSYPKQVAMKKDSSAENGYPSISHFIKRAFLISENDPYNRMYQFVGQQDINRKLHSKGYPTVRITRQFMGNTEDQNRHTNAIHFYDYNGKMLHDQLPAFNTDPFDFSQEIKIGKAHYNRDDSLINAPFDFTKHNFVALEDFRKMLQSVIFPASVSPSQRFNIRENDRQFLLKYLSQYPSETSFPKYDTNTFYDSYVKFYFLDSSHKMPPHIRVFNKVGWAYGFMTDVSYILDTKNNIDYMIASTIYVNSDEVLNDDKYEFESIGRPFFRNLGEAIYNYELKRKRTYHPTLKNPVVSYDKRNPNDNRPSIVQADN